MESQEWMGELEWVKGKVKIAHLCQTFCNPMDCIVHEILQAWILEWMAFPFSRGCSHPGIKHRSLALQADSLPAEPQGKPKNTGVGSLSLLQGILLTQELNHGLLYCKQILYQLSYQGSLLEWGAYPFSMGYSLPKNWTRVSCVAGGFFTRWVTREALIKSNR